MQTFIRLIKKFSFIIIPIITVFAIGKLPHCYMANVDSNTSLTIASISGTLAGFLLTIAMFYFNFSHDNKFIQALRTTIHNFVFGMAMLSGVLLFCLTIFLGILGITKYVFYVFCAGMTEVFIAAYYIARISYFYNKQK